VLLGVGRPEDQSEPCDQRKTQTRKGLLSGSDIYLPKSDLGQLQTFTMLNTMSASDEFFWFGIVG
jgi:hypothetical protein